MPGIRYTTNENVTTDSSSRATPIDFTSLSCLLTVDPRTSEVYLADALDYVQPGWVFRYSARGELLDSFQVGIIPGAFCFK